MELTVINKAQEKHHVVIQDNKVTIIRLGRVLKVSYDIKSDIGFNDAMTKINNVVNFDTEVFEMVGNIKIND